MIKHNFSKAYFSKPHKYKAKRTTRFIERLCCAINFDSKKEADRYEEIEKEIARGETYLCLRQVSFVLAGGEKFVLDHLLFKPNGVVVFEEVKGYKTATYLRKKKRISELYPFLEIKEI